MLNNAIDCYATLYFNPFILDPIISAFYEKAHVQPRNILLSYLILPLVLTESSKESSKTFLINSTSASSLRTFCKAACRLHGLPERVSEFKPLTQLCIQHLLDINEIKVEVDLSVSLKSRRSDYSMCPEGSIKAAQKLGTLLGEMSIVSIYRMLGVKKL